MALTPKEVSDLTSIILNGQSSLKTFDAISILFHKSFSKSEHFKIGKALVAILNSDLLSDGVSPIVCLFLIWDMYKSEPLEHNPFLRFVVNYLQRDSTHFNSSLPLPAKVFMHTLMKFADRARDLCKTTPLQLLTMDADVSALRSCDWSIFDARIQERLQSIPKFDSCGIPCVLPDDDTMKSTAFGVDRVSNETSASQRKHCIEGLLGSEMLVASMQSLRPNFLRLAPPIMPCPQASSAGSEVFRSNKSTTPCFPDSEWVEELVWLNPTTIEHQFHWDSSMGHSSPTFELRQLMSTALTSALTQAQQQIMVQSIKEDPNLIHSLGLTSENFTNLVNRNPVVAIEILLGLISTPEVNTYLSSLVKMNITVNSMEVVNRVAALVALPSEFIHTFISNCISTCQGTQDKYVQVRLVRLVCVLIQSLIRNKIIDVHNGGILVEVQSFCLEFNKIRDANTLYRLIKSIEVSGTAGHGTPPTSSETQVSQPREQ
nr:unnamed protein product [Spirometra erinaceieuropaei]